MMPTMQGSALDALNPPQAPPLGDPASIMAQLGISPEMAQQWVAGLQGLPPEQQVAALQNKLMSTPGVREKLQSLTQPQHPGMRPMDAPPTAGGPDGQGGSPDPNAAAGWEGGLNRGMQKRVEAGKELPPGIARRQPGAVAPAMGTGAGSRGKPQQGGTASLDAPVPMPLGGVGGAQTGSMTYQTGGGLQAAPQPAPTAPRLAGGGGGTMATGFPNYRLNRMGSPRVTR